MTTSPIDPLNPWAGDAAPVPVELPEPVLGGPPVSLPPDLPPAPGPRQTWADARELEVPLPQERPPTGA